MFLMTTTTRKQWVEIPDAGTDLSLAKGLAWRMFKEDRDGADVMIGEKVEGMVVVRAKRQTSNRRTYWRYV